MLMSIINEKNIKDKRKGHSDYTGVVKTLVRDQYFYNALGTSEDIISIDEVQWNDDFIKFWCEKTKTSESELKGIMCSNVTCEYRENWKMYELEGAHIVTSENRRKLKDNDQLFIIPLCPKCNNANNKSLMRLRSNTKAPMLRWCDNQ